MGRNFPFFKVFGDTFIASTVGAIALYFGLLFTLGRSPIIVAYPFVHITQYHTQFPLPYVLAVALSFSFLSSLWLVAIAPKVTSFRWVQVAALPLISALLAGSMCGVLWIIHDMLAGFFPSPPRTLSYVLFGVKYGFLLSPTVVMYSWPLSLPAYLTSVLILVIMMKRFEHGSLTGSRK